MSGTSIDFGALANRVPPAESASRTKSKSLAGGRDNARLHELEQNLAKVMQQFEQFKTGISQVVEDLQARQQRMERDYEQLPSTLQTGLGGIETRLGLMEQNQVLGKTNQQQQMLAIKQDLAVLTALVGKIWQAETESQAQQGKMIALAAAISKVNVEDLMKDKEKSK